MSNGTMSTFACGSCTVAADVFSAAARLGCVPVSTVVISRTTTPSTASAATVRRRLRRYPSDSETGG